ncbi:hypothetical protein [Prevotella histicola]
MTQKDLAEEYANERLQGRLSGNEISFSDNIVFTEDDIKAAFNAGRESVVENIPELEWKDEDRRGDEENYIEESYSLTPFGDYSILKWYAPTDITIYFNGEHFKSNIMSVQQAKQAANEDYKQRIKQALGL